jgi:two-component system NtrC family sensor kinase
VKSEASILVLSDTPEAEAYLSGELLPGAGYRVLTLGDLSQSVYCDAILVEITHLRANPLANLHTQRHLGNHAPALLIAPRLTSEMAAEVFPLNIRDFVQKPADTTALLDRLAALVSYAHREQEVAALRWDIAQMQASLTKRIDETGALSRIGRSLMTLSSKEAVLERVVEAAAFLTHADEAALHLIDETNRLVLRAHHGLSARQVACLEQPQEGSDAFTVLRTGQPVVHSGESGRVFIAEEYPVSAAISVPLLRGRRVIGVQAVCHQHEAFFDAADQAILSSLADYTIIALDRIDLITAGQAQVNAALETGYRIGLHANTLLSPVDGIESQVATLLAGDHGPLNETQWAAVTRIQQAAERLKEIVAFIQAELKGSKN